MITEALKINSIYDYVISDGHIGCFIIVGLCATVDYFDIIPNRDKITVSVGSTNLSTYNR